MAACSPTGPKPFDAMSVEEHLACAVDISAYTYLVAERKIPEDRDLVGQSALALAWHHNAYAIPSGKGESGDAINAARKDLLAAEAPEAISARAAACIAAATAKGAAS